MKKAKKNNKGFSLVELIVVVLIMAIIAVALAPQVMKWVENSRIATDIQNYDSLVANCQLALADKDALKAVETKEYTITYTDDSMSVKPEGGTAITSNFKSSTDPVIKALNSLDPSWSELRTKASAAPATGYVITINAGGTVSKTTPATDGNMK